MKSKKPEEQNNKKYLVASLYYVIGNVIGQGCVLLSSIIFTRIMSKDAYGLVNTYAAWVLVLNTFIGLNLFITVRNAYLDYKEDYEAFQSSVLLLSLLSGVFFTGVIVGGVRILGIHTEISVILIAAIQAMSLHTINFQMAVWSMENRYKLRTMLLVAPNIFHTVMSVVLIFIFPQHQYFAKICGNSFGMAVFAIGIIFYTFHNASCKGAARFWKYAVLISVPAIMSTLSDLLLMQSDRIMLTHMVGASETAVYSLVYNIGSILIALYTAINGSWTPWFYKKLDEEKIDEIHRVQKMYVYVFTYMAIGLLTISPEVVKVLSPKTYWTGIGYVNLIVIASFLIYLYAFFTTYLMYLKKTGTIAVNTMIAAILNIILNYFLIPRYKAYGAAYATIISYAVLFILQYMAMNKQGRAVFDLKSIGMGITIIVVYGGLFYCIKENGIIRYGIVAIMLVIAFVVFLEYKKGRWKEE